MGHSLGSADNIHSTRTGTVNRPARYGLIPCGHRGCAKPFAPPANAIKEQAVWVWQNYSRCPRKCLGVLHQCGPSTCTPLPAQTHLLAWECMHRMMPSNSACAIHSQPTLIIYFCRLSYYNFFFCVCVCNTTTIAYRKHMNTKGV